MNVDHVTIDGRLVKGGCTTRSSTARRPRPRTRRRWRRCRRRTRCSTSRGWATFTRCRRDQPAGAGRRRRKTAKAPTPPRAAPVARRRGLRSSAGAAQADRAEAARRKRRPATPARPAGFSAERPTSIWPSVTRAERRHHARGHSEGAVVGAGDVSKTSATSTPHVGRLVPGGSPADATFLQRLPRADDPDPHAHRRGRQPQARDGRWSSRTPPPRRRRARSLAGRVDLAAAVPRSKPGGAPSPGRRTRTPAT